MKLELLLAVLEDRLVITTDPEKKAECCGVPRDEDGFCQHRLGHPIFVDKVEL